MTPAVAVLANDYFTSSSAATTTARSAQVLCMGVISTRPAESTLGTPEGPIDYDAGAATLLAAADVAEADSTSVSPGSPFGI